MLQALTIKNFKKFNDRKVEFKPGLNVIWGRNEAGKSSLMNALFTVLFVDATTKARNFYDSVASWGNGSKQIFLELSLRNGDKEYSIGRDFGAGRQWFKGDGKEFDDPKTIDGELENLIGIPRQEIFESTLFIRQSEITNIHFTRDLRAALQRVTAISPEGANLEHSIKNLQDELQQLQLGLNRPSKTPGPIKATQDELQQLKSAFQEKQSQWEKVLNAKNSGEKSDGSLKDLEKNISELESLFVNYRKLEDGNKQMKVVEEQLNDVTATLNQVQSEKLQMKQVEAQIQQLSDFAKPDLEAAAQQLLKIKQTIKSQNEMLQELQEQLKQQQPVKLDYLKTTQKTDFTKQLLNTGAVAIGAIFLAYLAKSFWQNDYTNAIFLFSIGVGLIAVALTFAKYFLSEDGTENTGQEQNKVNVLQTQAQSLQEKINQGREQQKNIINQFNVVDTNEFFTKKATYNTLQQEKQRIESTISGILTGKTIQEVEQKQLDLLKQKKELETNTLTPEVKAASLTPNEYLRKRRELDMLLIEQRRLVQDVTRSEVISEESGVSREEIVILEEKIEMLEARLLALQTRKNILEVTIDLLQQVIKATGKSAGKVVSQEVEKYLPKLTINRYKDLRLNENYDIQVFSSEKNDWVEPMYKLSLGTVDQIYFLSRVALGKALLGGNLPYLFLDDPFITFDEERLTQMREILQEFASQTQIFLFTHDAKYKDWGNLIEL